MKFPTHSPIWGSVFSWLALLIRWRTRPEKCVRHDGWPLTKVHVFYPVPLKTLMETTASVYWYHDSWSHSAFEKYCYAIINYTIASDLSRSYQNYLGVNTISGNIMSITTNFPMSWHHYGDTSLPIRIARGRGTSQYTCFHIWISCGVTMLRLWTWMFWLMRLPPLHNTLVFKLWRVSVERISRVTVKVPDS
jgi:hypothetical protein